MSPIEWISKIAEHLSIDLDEKEKKQFMEISDDNIDIPEREDQKKHIRQKKPGDHKRKLKPETIEVLNSEFGAVLKALQYPI
jgi:hypothetical protein